MQRSMHDRKSWPDNSEVLPDLCGTVEGAEILGVSPQRVVQIYERLGGKKVGKTLVFSVAHLKKIAKERQVP